MKHPLPLVAALLLAACGPEDRSGTVRAHVYARDAQTGDYALRVADVEHLDSLRRLSGRDVVVRRGARLNVTLLGELEVDEGSDFALEYDFDDDGAVVPADLHSFHALSLYRNIDRVASHLRAHGHVPSERFRVLYMPRYDNPVLGDGRLTLTDNAAYLAQERAFLILPSFLLSELPMLLNEGVVAHEYGHAVVHQELFGEARAEPHADDPADEWRVASRHLQCLHEGVADVIAFAVVGDPDFILPTVDANRDMSRPRDLTLADVQEIEARPAPDDLFGTTAQLDPHYQGSTLARTVYELWPKDDGDSISEAGRSRLLRLSLEALRSIRYVAGEFTLAAFLDALIAQLDADEKPAACAVALRRFAPLSDRLHACEEL